MSVLYVLVPDENLSKCTFYRNTFYVKYIRIIMRSRWNVNSQSDTHIHMYKLLNNPFCILHSAIAYTAKTPSVPLQRPPEWPSLSESINSIWFYSSAQMFNANPLEGRTEEYIHAVWPQACNKSPMEFSRTGPNQTPPTPKSTQELWL